MSRATILHVEDDSDDAFFVGRAFGKLGSNCTVQRVKDGREALEYLAALCDPKLGGTDSVQAVLLDLKLPQVDGFGLLQWIRSQPKLNHLPVVILSGSSVESDRSRARQLGANEYFVKTPDYADVVDFVARNLGSCIGPATPADDPSPGTSPGPVSI